MNRHGLRTWEVRNYIKETIILPAMPKYIIASQRERVRQQMNPHLLSIWLGGRNLLTDEIWYLEHDET